MPPELETSGAYISLEETQALLDWEQAVCLAGDINPDVILGKDPRHYRKDRLCEKDPQDDQRAVAGFTGQGVKRLYRRRARKLACLGQCGRSPGHLTAWHAGADHAPAALFGAEDYRDLGRAIQSRKLDTRLLLMCTDDIQPHILMENGHLDERMKLAIAGGIDPLTAIQMVTINVADYFRIDRDFGSLTRQICRYCDLE